ncbi:hypothetical protein CTEN210_15903 [Chaetoceros tenuissimus]|uniref:Uncharacterized protein n=1 Tax=Chaetoceros tenuissimus TaxID=426638 RepID=A0AAD3D7N2_9STRA|nr:hypothetical protein CTEN210_15903 [Chaetoceros tenuissimus]
MKATTIEVCQGPDCKGIGGGAALLEIEELVQNIPSHSITVQPGGCRNFCSMGPNVHLLERKCIQESFHQVKNVDMCRDIVNMMDGCKDSSCSSPTKNILLQRANKKRWEMLKQISLILSKCYKEISQMEDEKDRKSKLCKKRKQDCHELIMNIYQVEISASSRDSIVVDVAKRRFERLNALMDLKFNALMNRDESEDEDDDSSSDESESCE